MQPVWSSDQLSLQQLGETKLWRSVGEGIYPVAVVAHSLPKVVVAPILVSPDPRGISLLRTMGATQWQIFLKLRLPQACPSLFAGLKIAASAAGVGTVVGEFFASSSGLGYLLLAAAAHLDTAMLFVAAAGASALALSLYYLVEVAEALIDPRRRRQGERRCSPGRVSA